MTNKKMIRLLSVLLLTVTVLTGCNGVSAPETDSSGPNETATALVNEETPHAPVEPKLENFFKLSSEKGWDDLGKATRFDGTLVSSSDDGRIIVLRTADVDVKNTVTETFVAYNTELKKEVFRASNTYQNGSYSHFDWDNVMITDETVKYPEAVMDVSVEIITDSLYEEIPVIKVSRAQVTPIDEKVREENPDACVYEIALSYEFYDVSGREIAKTKRDDFQIDASIDSYSSVGVRFESTLAVFDIESLQLISAVNGETGAVLGGYDFENEKYGYFLNRSMSFSGVPSTEFIEVYSKSSGNRILRYYLDRNYNAQTFVLEDGDILIQYLGMIPEESNRTPDFYLGDAKMTLLHGILDVETGRYQSVETGCLISQFIPYSALDEYDFAGVEFTENVLNLANVHLIEDQRLGDRAIKVFDNDCAEMFKLDLLTPEHDMESASSSPFGFAILANGDYLVDLVDTVSPKAIVTADGEIRSYLPEEAAVTDKYVVTSDGIFDYDLNCLYVFKDGQYTLECVIGNRIIASSTVEDGDLTAVKSYCELVAEDDSFRSVDLFPNADVYLITESYVIVRNRETLKYSLYNAELDHVLTTQNEMTVYELEGNYLVYTYLEGHDLFYTID